jgi:CheY-like chemotaxis protein
LDSRSDEQQKVDCDWSVDRLTGEPGFTLSAWAPAGTGPTVPSVLSNSSRSSRPVLLVEDDPVYRNALCRLLRYDGHEVLTAKDGEEALELLSNDLLHAPWVIVTDLKMPGRDGQALIGEVRANTRWRDIPIVVITGLPASERPEITAEVLLIKPVSHLQLHEKLCELAPTYGQRAPRSEAARY